MKCQHDYDIEDCMACLREDRDDMREAIVEMDYLRARVAELEATITTMQDEADIVQIGSNRRWDLLEEARTNFYHIDLGTTGNETASELAHRMAEKIHLELYDDLETNKD